MNRSFERFASASDLEAYLINDAVERYGNLFGQPGYGYWPPGIYPPVLYDDIAISFDTTTLPAALPAPVAAAETLPDTTNTQVDGVDEADLIETDGQYLYQANGQAITIVNAAEPDDLAIASQFSLDVPWVQQNTNDHNTSGTVSGTTSASTTVLPVEPLFPIGGPVWPRGWGRINGMYLHRSPQGEANRLTVIASGSGAVGPFAKPGAQRGDGDRRSLSFPGPTLMPHVQVTVLDVTHPNRVSIIETSILEGSLVSSRAIGNEVVVVTNDSFRLPKPLILESDLTNKAAESTSSVDRVAEKTNITQPVIAEPVIVEVDAPVTDSAPAPLIDTLIFPYDPYPYPQGTYETQAAYLERLGDEVLNLALPNVQTLNGQGQTVASGLLTNPTDIYRPLESSSWQQLTTVSTFDVGDDHLGVDDSTSIPMEWVSEVFVSQEALYLLRQIYDFTPFGNANVSTEILKFDLETSELLAKGQVPGGIDNQFSVDEQNGFLRISTTNGFGRASRNNIYVLEQQGSSLDVVGKVEGLAPGERIFSTRFQGDYGFVVTFRQVDPLFAIDLSDPRNPRVVGELKIPGFSEYLQVIEQDEKTLLLGIGRDADPITGRAGALKVSLFDVTDLANPIELDNYIFSGDFSSSSALWDHKAITYVPEQQLLAIPTSEYRDNFQTLQTRLSVFSVDDQTGLTSLGEIEHSGDRINRSVSIEDTLYAFSQRKISGYDLTGLSQRSAVSWKPEDIAPLGFAPPNSPFASPGFFDAERSGLTITANPASEALPGSSNDDAIDGGNGNDKLYGNGGRDVFFGGDGNDEIYGGNGSDIAFGGSGNDVMYGNESRDILLGNAGDDRILAGGGNDWLRGGAGQDQLTGGEGSDWFVYGSGDGVSGDGDSAGNGVGDVIVDFQLGIDRIGLITGELTVADLSIVQQGTATVIGIASSQTTLARLPFVEVKALRQNLDSNFISVAAVSNTEQALQALSL